MAVLTLNAGSSTIRFALHELHNPRSVRFKGMLERIGLPGTALSVAQGGSAPATQPLATPPRDFAAAVGCVLDWLTMQLAPGELSAIGHRVVHGMRRSSPTRVTAALLEELRGIVPFDPEHLPSEIALMEATLARFTRVPQVACFDTAFHRTLPRVAALLSIPRRYEAQGVQRYGFHGLSYTFLLEELARLGDETARRGRVVLAHLGNGASLAAVRDGACIDTSMGFTPTGGIPMSTRTGDLDPSVLVFLAASERMDAARLGRLVTDESGLLGLSETSSDVRDLLAREARDVRAAEALACFCYQTRKWIGAFAAALGGLDTLVFSAGIGENAPVVRARICAGLEFLGLTLDAERNGANAPIISRDGGHVAVRVIRTDEAAVIARLTTELLGLTPLS